MFRSAAIKLALSYLAVIMSLSLGFTIVVYRISRGEIDRGLRPPAFTLTFQGSAQLNFEQYHNAVLEKSSGKLRNNLILLNLTVLTVGGGISYLLARRTLEPIEEALEAQSRFTADASHELRTPLTAMQTEIEVALRNPKLTGDEAKDLLKSNLEEVAKLEALSVGLLRLARPGGEGLEIKQWPVYKLANEAITGTQKVASLKNVKLKNEITTAKAQPKVLADKHALIEALVILLDNAIKYSGPDTTVRISSEQHGHHTLVHVTDEGQGIKASDQPHIFDRFYRADASRNKSQAAGYGLGLAIAQKIIHLHDGTLTVKSTPGEGSTFTIKLPLGL